MPKQRPDAGRRLLPSVVDELADTEPDRVLYEVPVDKDLVLPYRKITARQYAQAIDRAAWWLRDSLGEAQGPTPTVGYTGPGDLRYFILVIAAIKVGYKMLYISPRNSIEGDIAVIQAAECNLWLVPSSGSNIHRVLESVPLKLFDIPDLPYFLDGPFEDLTRYGYTKTWERGRRDPCWVLHTSGSTGNPKPVVRYLDSLASIEANTLLPLIDGRPILLHELFDSRVYATFPLFHSGGLAGGILWPLFWGSTVVLGPDRPLTSDVMKEVISKTKVDALYTIPSPLEDASNDAEALTLLESVKAVVYAGGPLSKVAGDRIIKHTKVRLFIGSTESGWLPCVETDVQDWNYLHFHPQSGLELQDRGGGLFELVAVRKPEFERWQPIFSTFPQVSEYSFKDLFSRHPQKPDLFTYEGRADNVIVLSNGEKFQPHTMELVISSHPDVESAIVAGQGRFQISLLLEPSQAVEPGSADEEAFISKLWPTISAANKESPNHAKLLRELILIARPDKPFSRTSKGTIRRGPSLELYKEELDTLYELADKVGDKEDSLTKEQLESEELVTFVRTTLQQIAGSRIQTASDDFFTVTGLDSLQVLTLRRYLNKKLPIPVTSRTIYENPTLERLVKAIRTLGSPPLVNGTHPAKAATDEDVLQMVSKYGRRSPEYQLDDVAIQHGRAGKKVVVLTGSTGSLGSYLLDDLMNRGDVHEIWCLNRSKDAQQRQLKHNNIRGLRTDFKARRVHFRHVDLATPGLGLDAFEYGSLLARATHVIHTQWRVDFNLSLTSFQPQIHGVRNLIDFVIQASGVGNKVRLVFTSSVGVANGFHGTVNIPEQKLVDSSGASSGYGKSKYVAEELIWQASQQHGIDAVICRVGQIAGPVKQEHSGGQWNRKEWLPSIVDLSHKVSLVPKTLGLNEEIVWIPVDILSSIILELAVDSPSKSGGGGVVYHCVNPSEASWERDLLPTVRSTLAEKSGSTGIQVAPFEQWVEIVKLASAEAESQRDGTVESSSFALIDFMSGLAAGSEEKRARFDTTSTEAASAILKDLPSVNAAWVKIWLRQWGY